MATIHDAWLESIRFQKDEFKLILFMLKPEEIHSLLNEILSLQGIDQIELASRKQELMKGPGHQFCFPRPDGFLFGKREIGK